VSFIAIGGLVLRNEVKLCHQHHVDVTDHHAWIIYEAAIGWVWWHETKDPNEGGVFKVHEKSGRVFRRVGPL
jgi:hypothetical protein